MKNELSNLQIPFFLSYTENVKMLILKLNKNFFVIPQSQVDIFQPLDSPKHKVI